ncbi:MAG: hypothetical protein ACOX6Y_02390 [Christensenellales bacterium]
MHTVQEKALHYGLQITASHNPSTYNGIKLIVEGGRDAPEDVTDGLESASLSCPHQATAPAPCPLIRPKAKGSSSISKILSMILLTASSPRIRMDIIR